MSLLVMKDIIQTNLELCVGCEKCVEQCPVEMANIVYQDEAGLTKVIVDKQKCAVCGRCIPVCPRKARHYAEESC